MATNTQAFATQALAPGVQGISNGALDALWPKTARMMATASHWLALQDRETPDLEPFFAALADTRIASDEHLPHTYVGIERERFLSPAFIAHTPYGTRASTIAMIADDHAYIVERQFGAEAYLKAKPGCAWCSPLPEAAKAARDGSKWMPIPINECDISQMMGNADGGIEGGSEGER